MPQKLQPGDNYRKTDTFKITPMHCFWKYEIKVDLLEATVQKNKSELANYYSTRVRGRC